MLEALKDPSPDPPSQSSGGSTSPQRGEVKKGGSLHRVVLPVLHARDLAAVPLVDAVVELRAEVIVLGPYDRTATQALGVDGQVLHRAAQLGAISARAGRLQRRLDRHAADPAFGHGLARIFRAG